MQVDHLWREIVGSFVPVVFAFLVAMPLAAYADSQTSEIIFSLEARNDDGSGVFEATFDDGQVDPATDTLIWNLSAPVDICDDASGERVATLIDAGLTVCMRQRCSIDLSIAVLSGDSSTTFNIASPLVSFPTIPAESAKARASASFTVSDLGHDGAALMGSGTPGTGAFRGYYNGFLSEGTRFTHLVALIYVDNGGEANASQADPSSGYRRIGEDVDDFSTEIAFTVTPQDLAAATTTMEVPEPVVCAGDVNGDGVIDFADLTEFLTAYGSSIGEPDYNSAADFDRDCSVDIADLAALLAAYGETCP